MKISKPVLLFLEREIINRWDLDKERRAGFLGSEDYLIMIMLANQAQWVEIDMIIQRHNYFQSDDSAKPALIQYTETDTFYG